MNFMRAATVHMNIQWGEYDTREKNIKDLVGTVDVRLIDRIQ
jgi:hypothetical protein